MAGGWTGHNRLEEEVVEVGCRDHSPRGEGVAAEGGRPSWGLRRHLGELSLGLKIYFVLAFKRVLDLISRFCS